MSATRERYYRALFWVAAVYDLSLGIMFLFFAEPAFELLGVEDELPEFTGYVSLIAAFLFVIGVAYVFIALGNLVRNRDLIAVGTLYKLAYASVAVYYWAIGSYPHIVFVAVFGIADVVFLLLMAECWWHLGHTEPRRTVTAGGAPQLT